MSAKFGKDILTNTKVMARQTRKTAQFSLVAGAEVSLDPHNFLQNA